MIRAAAVALALLAGAKTPHDAVYRFIADKSPADACAQLAPAYKAAIAKRYGPCLAGMKVQPKATHIRTSRERISGVKATVDASYDANGGHFKERYTLVRTRRIWLIEGAKQIP